MSPPGPAKSPLRPDCLRRCLFREFLFHSYSVQAVFSPAEKEGGCRKIDRKLSLMAPGRNMGLGMPATL